MNKVAGKYTVVYDADCGICEKFRQFIENLDSKKKLRFLDFNNPETSKEYPHLNIEECKVEIKFIDPQGQIYGGGDAVARTFCQVLILSPLGWLGRLPVCKQILAWLYPLVARNRYRFSAACGLKRNNK